MNESSDKELVLPDSILSHADLSRLVLEIEKLEDSLQAGAVRGTKGQEFQPNESARQFFELNGLDPSAASGLVGVKKRVEALLRHAPVTHLTFAGEIDEASLEQLVAWLRKNTHPQALVSTGLQPSLVGGVYLRSPNHVYDLTIKRLLKDKRGVLLEELESLK